MGIESVLKAGLKALPEKTKLKGQQLPNALKKMGVKDEELQFSGIDIQADKTYSKADLEELEASRTDKFGKHTPTQSYQFVSLEAGQANPTYKENVYTFAEGTGPKPKVLSEAERSTIMDYIDGDQYTRDGLEDNITSLVNQFGVPTEDVDRFGLRGVAEDLLTGAPKDSRFTSEHFPDVPNYLMHTRTFDDTVEGKPTRIVQEIQSDLHQQGRAQGYDGDAQQLTTREKELTDNAFAVQQVLDDNEEALEMFGVSSTALRTEYEALAERAGLSDIDRASMSVEEILMSIDNPSNVPKSPYEKSWLAKGIERELDSAVADGRQQLAIPIKGPDVANLNRAAGVQKWYEGQVANTAKKIAKQNGMDFELKNVGDKVVSVGLAKEDLAKIRKVYDEEGVLHRGTGFEAALNMLIKKDGVPEGVDKSDLLGRILDGRNIDELNKAFSHEGTQYAIIKPKATSAESLNLKLYSSPAAAVGAGYASIKAGGTEDDVRFELSQAGYDSDEAEEILGDINFAKESIEVHGDSEEEVLAFFKSQEPEIAEVKATPVEQAPEKSFWERVDDTAQVYNGNPKKEAYGAITSDENMNAEQLLSHLQVISPNMSSITTRISSYYGNETAAKKQEEAVTASAQHIVNLAKEHGIDLAFQPNPEGDGIDQLSAFGGGKWFTTGPDGQAVPVDEGFWEAMRQESHEITYGVTGAVAGAKMVSNVTKNPYLVGLGSIAGAVLGASGGTQLDYLRDSVTLHEDMSAGVAAHKALTAAEASVIGDLVGYPLAKGAGAIWSGVKQAKDFLLDGNTAGAYKALKDTMFLDESEIADITISLQKATTTDTSKLKPLEQQIQATVLTQPGGEAVVQAAGSIDARASAAVSKGIDDRAKDILATTATLTDENVGRILATDLSNYTGDVKKFYGDVKGQVAKSPRINDFAWDYDKLAIKPVLEQLHSNIMDPTVLGRFELQQQSINNMTDSRTLTDLLELRQMVNDFKFNKRITKAKDFDTLNKVLSNVDGAIRQGAGVVMEEPEKWLGDYALAKTQYAKMKGLERNVIARALRLPGLTEASAVRSLTKYITSLDGTFQDIMTSLPKESRKLAEGAVVDVLANKFTAGSGDGMRAVHFPLLAAELDKVSFTMPEARKAKAAIKEMAEVFRNDVPLSQSTGNIQIPKFQSYLTVDPVVRAKFEIASSMFNWVKKLAPTANQRNMALVSKTAKLLENPLNAKLMREVMDEAGGDTNLVKQLVDLQKEAAKAKAAGDVGSTKVNFYGDGPVLSAKGSGNVTKIPVHRIATYDVQKTVANKYGVDINDKVGLADALKAEGYMAVQQGSDKVRRLK